jgi:hypothetical protein
VFGLKLVELRALEKKEDPPVPLDQLQTLKPNKTYVLQNMIRNPQATKMLYGFVCEEDKAVFLVFFNFVSFSPSPIRAEKSRSRPAMRSS